MQKDELWQLLSRAYADDEVKTDEALQQIIFQSAQELDKTADWKLVCLKLNQALSGYLLTNHLKAPKCIEQLLVKTAKYAEKYRGVANQSVLLGNLFQ
ncbi:bacteriocin immunity protein [Leuconostoc citreum]